MPDEKGKDARDSAFRALLPGSLWAHRHAFIVEAGVEGRCKMRRSRANQVPKSMQ
jgi:hypothetical protein